MADRAFGAAMRRRQRRLRSCWRHEQQSIAAVLATVTHHSHSKVGTANAALRGQKTGTSTRVGPAEYFELSSDDGRPTGGERPAALSEPWPQGKLLRHVGVGYELVHRLDVPVPQMGEQLPNIVQFFAAQLPVVAEPVIEVPKIFLDKTPQRLGDSLRQPQMVEQLVHVPTVVSFSSLQQLTAEQIVNIPVPGGDGGGRCGGLQGSLPRQNSAALNVEQTVDIPVPGRAGGGRGGLQGFPEQGSTASSSHVGAADGAGQGVFHPSTLSAHQMPPEQLVDVPVPLVHERSSYDQETRLFLESLHRRREALEAARLVTVAEEQMEEEAEEEEVEVSRFLPHFRAGAGTCLPAASALVGGTAHLHTMSRSFILTHGSALCWWKVGPGFRGLASLGPFLGAPAGSPGQVKYTGGTGSGAWHPLTPSWVPFRGVPCHRSWKMWRWISLCLLLGGTDRGMPVPQIMPVRGGGQRSACFHRCSSWTRLLTCLLRP